MQDGPYEFTNAFRRKKSSTAGGSVSRPEIMAQWQSVRENFQPIKEVGRGKRGTNKSDQQINEPVKE